MINFLATIVDEECLHYLIFLRHICLLSVAFDDEIDSIKITAAVIIAYIFVLILMGIKKKSDHVTVIN